MRVKKALVLWLKFLRTEQVSDIFIQELVRLVSDSAYARRVVWSKFRIDGKVYPNGICDEPNLNELFCWSNTTAADSGDWNELYTAYPEDIDYYI